MTAAVAVILAAALLVSVKAKALVAIPVLAVVCLVATAQLCEASPVAVLADMLDAGPTVACDIGPGQ